MKKIETGLRLQLDFSKLTTVAKCGDIIPAVVQDAISKDVLIIGYVNKIAFDHGLKTKKMTFWSTSRNELWVKGLTSGDYLEIKEVRVNCEQNSLLFLVEPKGKGACHVKDDNGQPYKTCFYRRVSGDNLELI